MTCFFPLHLIVVVAYLHLEPHGVALVSFVRARQQEGRGCNSQAVLLFSLHVVPVCLGSLLVFWIIGNSPQKFVHWCECVVWMVGCLQVALSHDKLMTCRGQNPACAPRQLGSGINSLRTPHPHPPVLDKAVFEIGWIVFIFIFFCLCWASVAQRR